MAIHSPFETSPGSDGRTKVTLPGTRATRLTPSPSVTRSAYMPGSSRNTSPARAALAAAASDEEVNDALDPTPMVRAPPISVSGVRQTSRRAPSTPAIAPSANHVVLLCTIQRNE